MLTRRSIVILLALLVNVTVLAPWLVRAGDPVWATDLCSAAGPANPAAGGAPAPPADAHVHCTLCAMPAAIDPPASTASMLRAPTRAFAVRLALSSDRASERTGLSRIRPQPPPAPLPV